MCTLHSRIIELCKEKGISGSRMCLDLGMSKSTLSDLKSGRKKSFTADTAHRIASYLGVSVAYLLGEEQKEEQKEKPTIPEDDGLSESQKALMQFSRSVPADKAEKVLKLMQAILEAD